MTIYRIGPEHHYTKRPASMIWPKAYTDNTLDEIERAYECASTEGKGQRIYRSKNGKKYEEITLEDLKNDIELLKIIKEDKS